MTGLIHFLLPPLITFSAREAIFLDGLDEMAQEPFYAENWRNFFGFWFFLRICLYTPPDFMSEIFFIIIIISHHSRPS